MRISLFICFFFLSATVFAQNLDSLLCTPYINSGLSMPSTGNSSFIGTYSPSGSTWAVDSFPESVVFHAQLDYTDPLDSAESYSLRIGKGGNIYSFRGAFGESVPPQWRNPNWAQPSYGGGTSYAPWVDEVWQMVAVDGALNNGPDSSYFVHQAGVYLKTPEQTQPFYSPMLAEYYNDDDRSYSVVNWGQQAHTEDLQNINFQSDMLYYTRYTVIGEGILQVDNMMYNFGQDNISFINVPWGGVRNSSLDHFFISDPSGNYTLEEGLYGQTPVIQTASTGGWVAWSNDSLGNSPVLAMAHPKNTSTNNSVFRYGDAGNLSSPNNQRDYHVFEMIRFPSNEQLSFGTALSFRFFYVLGESVDSVRSAINDNGLVSAAFDSDFIPQKWEVDSIGYNIHSDGIGFSVSQTTNGMMLRSVPYLSSYPLFLITSNEGQAITSDPYHYSPIAYDGITENIELLGFLDNQSRVAVQYDTICSGASYLFPDGSNQILSAGQTYISTINSAQTDWDSLIFTHLSVIDLDTNVEQLGSALQSAALEANYQWLNCDNNYSAILGETDSIFEPVSGGNYAVQLSFEECVDTSACLEILLVGQTLQNGGIPFEIYPNPSSGIYQVKGMGTVTVFNALGELILTQNILGNSIIDLRTQANGIYSLQLQTEKGTLISKLIKE